MQQHDVLSITNVWVLILNLATAILSWPTMYLDAQLAWYPHSSNIAKATNLYLRSGINIIQFHINLIALKLSHNVILALEQ